MSCQILSYEACKLLLYTTVKAAMTSGVSILQKPGARAILHVKRRLKKAHSIHTALEVLFPVCLPQLLHIFMCGL